MDDGALARFWVLCATDAGMDKLAHDEFRIVMTKTHCHHIERDMVG